MNAPATSNAAIDPILLTRQLVEIDSTTFCEGAAGDFLADFLAGREWAVEKTPVPQSEDGGEGPRWNVYAGLQSGTPDLVFSTHIDTVPPYVGFREDEKFLYGRGVCDAKGIIAAQIAAAEELRSAGFQIGLLFVSGEERDSAGAKIANDNPKGSRYLINGEPTDNRIAVASKGTLRSVLRATGVMAHSAYPELGDSAIHKLVEALHNVLAIQLPTTEDVGPSTVNVGMIYGGYAPNVISDKAEAHILTRLVGPSEPIREAMQKAADGLAEVEFGLDIPFLRLKGVDGLPTMIAKFTTDIPWLTNWGEPLLLGPGSIQVAHTPNEHIAKQEILDAVGLYVQVTRQLLS